MDIDNLVKIFYFFGVWSCLHSTSGFQETKIESFSPLFGPVSGGTRLTFKTQHLNLTTDITITLGNSSCSDVIKNNQRLICFAGRHVNPTTECVQVLITLDDVLQNISLQRFCYKPDPVVTHVEVGTILHSEDIDVTVFGSNFDSVASPKIVISFRDPITNKSLSLSGGCFTGNRNESMTCVISDLYIITEEYFKANGSGDFFDAELAIEMDNNYFNIKESLRKLKLKIYRSPKFANDTVQKTKLSTNDPILILSVPNLTMFNREDITVKVGNQMCSIVMLTESSLKCDAGNAIDNLQKKQAELDRQPKSDTGSNASSDDDALDGCTRLQPGEREVQCAVTLQIGNHVTELGHVTISLDPLSETGQTMVIVGTCLVAIVIMSLLVLTVVLLTRLKRGKMRKCQTIGGPGVDLISSVVVWCGAVGDVDTRNDSLPLCRRMGSHTFLRHHRLDQPHFCPDVMYGHMMSCWDEDPDKRPSFEALQTELLQLIDGGLQVSSVSSITADPSNHVCLSVDGQTAGFSNYQNASTTPFDISKQNTKGRDQVIGHVKDEMGVVSILNFAERNTIHNDVFITIPAGYSLKDRSEPMPVAQSHQGLHRNVSELRGEETEYV